jgi:multiple sugar transport system substrate-binding protein
MVRTTARVLGMVGAVAAAGLLLAACSGASPSALKTDEKVTITVGDMPPQAQAQGYKVYMDKVAAFEKANPNITLKTSEAKYDPQTFAAQLAGKTLPDTMGVPYTDIQSLIQRGQIKDMSASYQTDAALKALSPTVLKQLQAGGKTWAIPENANSLSLLLNRSVFEKAGLDPDTTPLTTWDDVAKAAKTITDKTDAAGLGMLTSNNQGGWILAAQAATFGGQYEKTDKAGKVTATVDNAGVKKALQYIHDRRWSDDSMGANFLMQFSDMGPQFASGKYGMMVGTSGWFGQFTITYKMDKNDLGVVPIPQTSSSVGILGGGTAIIVPASATDAQAAAAAKWTEFFYLNQYTDPKAARQAADITIANGGVVPGIGLPVVSDAAYQKYLAAVKSKINIPLDHFTDYLNSQKSSKFTIVTEPPVAAQQVYGIMDAVVQAVLTDKNADIDALLKTAQTSAASAVAQAQQ